MAKLQTQTDFSWRPHVFKPTGIIAGLVAVHIRRGDYLGDEGQDNGHCLHLSKWGSTFTGMYIDPRHAASVILKLCSRLEPASTVT